jgi:hypothetical protein
VSGVLRSIFRLLKGLFFWEISFLGVVIIITPEPIPGTDKKTSIIIGLTLIGIGGALARMFTRDNIERRKAKIWKKE